MNRKDFLSTAIPVAAVISATAGSKKLPGISFNEKKIPPYLKKGDTIGICCPSGYISLEDVQPAVNKMKEWGFEIKIGDTVGAKDFTFAGTDEQRARDVQSMMDDDSVNAIMFGRGGYGAVRIIDRLDFKKFAAKPKWMIGFSDITVFHSHLNKNYGIPSIHSKMCNSFPSDWSKAEPSQVETIDSIRKCLIGETMEYKCAASEKNRTGGAEGMLVGGNVSLIQSLASSRSDIDTAGKILFLEEVDEYLYSVDRMLWYLKRAGKLDRLKALIICGLKTKPDDPGEEFGRTVYDIVNEVVKEFTYPVCFDFPVGHQRNNYALKCGVRHELVVSNDVVTLKEA